MPKLLIFRLSLNLRFFFNYHIKTLTTFFITAKIHEKSYVHMIYNLLLRLAFNQS